MANLNLGAIKPPKSPNLPIAPIEYSHQHFDILNNALRLYFNQIDSLCKYVINPDIGYFLNCPYGAFADTTDQTAAAINTAYPITFNTQTSTDINFLFLNGAPDIFTDSPTYPASYVFVAFPAIYNFTYSLQLANSGGVGDVFVWLRVNGTTDVPLSASKFSMSATTTSLTATGSIQYEVTPSSSVNFVELMWSTTNTSISLDASVASAPVPAIPSATMSISFVSA